MSETIIGFINFTSDVHLNNLEFAVRRVTPFGFAFSKKIELYNYPDSLKKDKDVAKFYISDSNETNVATVLLEEQDYAPDSSQESNFQKKFPSSLHDRVLSISKIVNFIFQDDLVNRMAFSISFCDEIEHIKKVPVDEIECTLLADFRDSCPPNVLYIVE